MYRQAIQGNVPLVVAGSRFGEILARKPTQTLDLSGWFGGSTTGQFQARVPGDGCQCLAVTEGTTAPAIEPQAHRHRLCPGQRLTLVL